MRLAWRVWVIIALAVGAFLAKSSNKPPVYWINMNLNVDRRLTMESHLLTTGYTQHRIEALTPSTCNLIMIETACKRRVGFKEISILCSHLSALHYGIFVDNSTAARESQYMLLMEDDVRFAFDIDYGKLISMAPKGFGMIQLMMSHKEQLDPVWSTYKSHCHTKTPANGLWTYRPRNSTIWSAQAILVNKEVLRARVQAVVQTDRHGKLGFKIVGLFDFDHMNDMNAYRPVVHSQCIFSDMFLYSLGQPTYILNTPLLNGARIGLNSTSHQDHVAFHAQCFQEIARIQATGECPLPSFARPFHNKMKSTDSQVNWTAITEGLPPPIYIASKHKKTKTIEMNHIN